MNIDSQTYVHTNHLIDEKSPYLLQHAHNPVNWYPWSDEAFQKAHSENKPIFLSIGYSTCHWCHVMERESFEDEEVAELLNNNFISIKVDREERPDIDQIYMAFCQSTTGQGGWPLTVFLTPEKKPFYVGTYFPKTAKYGNPGLMDILGSVISKWSKNQEEIEDSAEQMTYMLNHRDKSEKGGNIAHDIFNQAYRYFNKNFDSKYGGFGASPKFPTPHNLLFLLRYYKAFNENHALEMVEKTLLQMYKGGIFDHIGFGFSRYSTDEKWLVPHFEKMLYDNALLMMAYTEAFQATGKVIYRNVAERIATYVLRDLRSTEGGFYCAEDADSEGVEGKFYVWSVEEVIDILGEDRGKFFCHYYNMSDKGNFEGKNILNFIKSLLEEVEEDQDIKLKLEDMAYELFHQREKRVHPHKDDKILTSWNGLMIAALAMAGRVFNNLEYINYAQQAIEFIERNLTREDGRLFARYRAGDVKHLAYQEDYAFVIWGYMELYEAMFQTQYLEKAMKLADDMIDIFEDENSSGFFLYGKDSEQLIARPKEIYDGALPSGNSTAALLFLKLSKLTGNRKYAEKIEHLFNYFANNINEAPMAYTMMLTARLFLEQHTKEIVLAGRREDTIIRGMIDNYNKRFLPFSVILLNKGDGDLDKVNDFAKDQGKLEGRSTAYVCENFRCQQPVIDVDAFNRLLD